MECIASQRFHLKDKVQSSKAGKLMNGSVVKKGPLPKKIRRSQVIKTLAEMDKEKIEQQQQQSQQQNADTTSSKNGSGAGDEFQDEFYTSGRIGRRNAMPDILGNNCTASSGADLPLKLSALTTNESSTSQSQPMNVNETPNQTNNK
ncbi:CLUMA_CG010670, isoform A [Clunio marinus]|uniref:CLUMA_CG010670, isoform A n=1 Tax=Clunio marinus TaxID=568069 RepID=A0A1J1IAP0_9DIPT|nr:CLUMA_CG010670, isoform A [Clunio marinus]